MKTQRVAMITGGAKRVGREVALTLARAGYDVAITYLGSRGDAVELQKEIQELGRKCVLIQANLEKPASAAATIIAKFTANFPRLDVLVNNASIYQPDSDDPDLARRFWAIHVESPLLLCRGFEAMLRKSRACIVNMVDLLAQRPQPGYLAYSASKAGLLNLTLGLAKQFAPEVRVNGIAPGVVEWPAGLPEKEKQKYLTRVPLARAGAPQDVASAIKFFCTEGSYLTGQILHVDGGRSIN